MHLRIPLPLTFKYSGLCSSIVFALALLKLAKHRCTSRFLRWMENAGPSYVSDISISVSEAVGISLHSLRVRSWGQIISSCLLVFQEPEAFYKISPRSRSALEWICLAFRKKKFKKKLCKGEAVTIWLRNLQRKFSTTLVIFKYLIGLNCICIEWACIVVIPPSCIWQVLWEVISPTWDCDELRR